MPMLSIGVVGYFITVFPAARAIPPAVLTVVVHVAVRRRQPARREDRRARPGDHLVPEARSTGARAWSSAPCRSLPSLRHVHARTCRRHRSRWVRRWRPRRSRSTRCSASNPRPSPPAALTIRSETIPRATLIGTLLVSIIYVAIVAISMLLVPQATLAASDAPFVTIARQPARRRQRPLARALRRHQRARLPERLDAAGRRTEAHALDAQAAAGSARRSNRFGAPWAALVVTGVLATFVGLMNYSDSLVAGFTLLSLIVTAANLPLYLCCSFAVYALLRRVPPACRRRSGSRVRAASRSRRSRSSASARKPFIWALALVAAWACRSISGCAGGIRPGHPRSRRKITAT